MVRLGFGEKVLV